MPYTLGLDREVEITAPHFQGAEPTWDQPWTEITLFYPGQVSWQHVNTSRHAGSGQVRAGVPVKFRHTETQLAHYGIEAEFRDEIRSQWLYSLFAGLFLLLGFGFALNKLIVRPEGV